MQTANRVPVFNACCLTFLFCFSILSLRAQSPAISLQDCFRIAAEHNLTVSQAKTTLKATEYNLAAEKQSHLPKVDLLASYNYLSKPLEINLGTVRNGIVEGSSQQSVNTANEVYKSITGNDLSQAAQQNIYNTSKAIIGGIYPDYNPPLSRQSYFLAGLFVRQPIYLGNKLGAIQNLAVSAVASARINVDVAGEQVSAAISAQYLRILYLNTILQKQASIVEILKKNETYAGEMVKNQVLPPYQKNWATVFLVQAESRYSNVQLEKKNAMLELNKLIGIPLDSGITIPDTLRYLDIRPADIRGESAGHDFWATNPLYKLVESRTAFAKTSEQIGRSLSLPNIFAIGNYNLFQQDLPVIAPPWSVGVEMQWNIFNGTQTLKRTQAARQLVEESRLAESNTRLGLQVQLQVALNKMEALQNDVRSLDTARREAQTTSRLIRERMQNQLSSPKDVNDALLIQEEADKAYFTAVLGYYLALATYYTIIGTPERIVEIIK